MVDNVDIEFHEGLTVLSGETGAGKSIIIEAICLALGKRANSNLVRAETDKAEITATFEITPDSPVCSLLKEFDYEIYDINYQRTNLSLLIKEMNDLPKNMYGIGNNFLVKKKSNFEKIINNVRLN